MSYRLLDELEPVTGKSSKPPWSPRLLFFMTVLFAPLGAVLLGINAARLGVPEKRLPAFLSGLGFALMLGGLFYSVHWLHASVTRDNASTAIIITSAGIGYWLYPSQLVLYNRYVARGGQKAGWPGVSLLIVLGIFLFLVRVSIRFGV